MTSPGTSKPPLIIRALRRLRFTLWGNRLGLGQPVPTSALDHEYASGAWDHFFGPDELPRHQALLELIGLVSPRPRLLDLGCGSGRLASMLRTDALQDYLGVDVSAEGLARARSLNLSHGRFLQADFEKWTPEPDQFDVITFNECLGYAPDPLRTARRFSNALSPGGALIVSHFRSTNHVAFWRRLSQSFDSLETKTVKNDLGQIWDLCVLVPSRP